MDTKINLCDTCEYSWPTCPAVRITFGDDIGNDNVIECDAFAPKQEV